MSVYFVLQLTSTRHSLFHFRQLCPCLYVDKVSLISFGYMIVVIGVVVGGGTDGWVGAGVRIGESGGVGIRVGAVVVGGTIVGVGGGGIFDGGDANIGLRYGSGTVAWAMIGIACVV
jgi:hypothetical protein